MNLPPLYHGTTAPDLRGPEVFLAYDRALADEYAGVDGVVLTVAYTGTRPMILSTPETFLKAWQASGADAVEGDFHPHATHCFAEWARAGGYDAIVVPPSACEGEDGYEAVVGRLGEAQVIVLDVACVQVGG